MHIVVKFIKALYLACRYLRFFLQVQPTVFIESGPGILSQGTDYKGNY